MESPRGLAYGLAILGFLLLEAFFSGSELGIVSADSMKLRLAAAKGSKGARLVLKMLRRPAWLLATTLVGTNIAVVANTTLTTALMIELLGPERSWLAIVLVAPLIWIFGEIVPKAVFQQKADVLAPIAIFPLHGASLLFSPILLLFTGITRLLTRITGAGAEANPFTLREELQAMFHMSPTGGDVKPHEHAMIRRLFRFSETTARSVMIPRVEIAAVDGSLPCGEAKRMAIEGGHRRLPVYEGSIDRILGAVDTLDLLGADPNDPITPFLREVEFTPDHRSIRDLLLLLRQRGPELAIVVDEFGSTEGLITLEDLLEEVVEEIDDEFADEQAPRPAVRKLGERHYLVDAHLDLDTLQDELPRLDLPRGDYATLSGFLLGQLQRIPVDGEEIPWENVTFVVDRALPQGIQSVRVRW